MVGYDIDEVKKKLRKKLFCCPIPQIDIITDSQGITFARVEG